MSIERVQHIQPWYRADELGWAGWDYTYEANTQVLRDRSTYTQEINCGGQKFNWQQKRILAWILRCQRRFRKIDESRISHSSSYLTKQLGALKFGTCHELEGKGEVLGNPRYAISGWSVFHESHKSSDCKNHNRHFPSPNYNITNLYSKKARSSPFESTVGEKTTMAIGKLEVERFDWLPLCEKVAP